LHIKAVLNTQLNVVKVFNPYVIWRYKYFIITKVKNEGMLIIHIELFFVKHNSFSPSINRWCMCVCICLHDHTWYTFSSQSISTLVIQDRRMSVTC